MTAYHVHGNKKKKIKTFLFSFCVKEVNSMKKITKIIPIISMIVMSILILIYLDFNESKRYLKFKNYNVETISIHYDENTENFKETIQNIFSIAKKNNIILAKSNVDHKVKNGNSVYILLDDLEQLKKLLGDNFKIDYFNNEMTSKGFISTYKNSEENQIGLIKDLFGDHFYSYYLMDQIFENKDSLVGTYHVFYKDFQDYSNFINSVNEFVGYDVHSVLLYSTIQRDIFILIVGSFIFLFLFYFIFQVYECYNNSNKIGSMNLLGFDTFKMGIVMTRKSVKANLLAMFAILILSLCIVKNLMIRHFVLIIIVNLVIILITYLINCLSCKIINKSHKSVNILKKDNVAFKISKISYCFKSIMIIMVIIFSMLVFKNVDDLSGKLKNYKNSKNLLDYGVFDSFIAGQSELYYYDNQNQLYLDIVNNFETIYAQFYDYSQITSSDWDSINQAEKSGTNFIYDSVDKNYLRKEKFILYDMNGKKVEIDSIESICFLFPMSKRDYIKPFEKFNEELDDYYRKYNKNYKFTAYLYDDRKVDTYSVDYKYVENPILRVVDNVLPAQNFLDGISMDFFGTGMSTGLKIKLVDNDKKETLNLLQKYIEKNELTNLLDQSNFISYREYFNDEILASKLILLFIGTGISITIIVYILISSQLLKLFISNQKQRVAVKKLLGFDNNLIFNQLFQKNLKNMLISIIIALLILILLKQLNIFFIFIVFGLLILDFFMILLNIQMTKLSTIYLVLKGGNYD